MENMILMLMSYSGTSYWEGDGIESMDEQGCAILALDLVPKNFISRIKTQPINLFHSQKRQERTTEHYCIPMMVFRLF